MESTPDEKHFRIIIWWLDLAQRVAVQRMPQNATVVTAIADHGNRWTVLEGSAEQLQDNARIKQSYLRSTEVGAPKLHNNVQLYMRRER